MELLIAPEFTSHRTGEEVSWRPVAAAFGSASVLRNFRSKQPRGHGGFPVVHKQRKPAVDSHKTFADYHLAVAFLDQGADPGLVNRTQLSLDLPTTDTILRVHPELTQ